MKRPFFWVLCWSLATLAQAQPVALTLTEALKRGFQTHPDLAAAEAALEAARARFKQAQSAFQPRVQFSSTYHRLSEITPFAITLPLPGAEPIEITPNIPNQYQLQLTLEQPLFQGGRLRAQTQAAAFGAAEAQAQRQARREALAYRIAAAYWQRVEAEALTRAAEENIRRLEAHLQDARNRQAQGLLLESQVLEVQVALEQARLDRLRQQEYLKLATVTLNSLIGLPLETPLALLEQPDTAYQPVPSLDSLRDLALRRRPDLEALRLRVAQANAAQLVARAAWWPQLALVGRYLYARPNPRIIPLQDRFEGTWEVGLSLTLTLWNGLRTRHQVAEAAAHRRQAEAQIEQALRDLDIALEQARLEVGQAYERLKMTRLLVRQAQSRYNVARDQFAQGLLASSDLLDAETALTQAHLQEIQAQLAYTRAWLALRYTTGSLTLEP